MYWNLSILTIHAHPNRLTLTWDVLKLLKLSYPCSSSIGLTLTWDVLKFS